MTAGGSIASGDHLENMACGNEWQRDSDGKRVCQRDSDENAGEVSRCREMQDEGENRENGGKFKIYPHSLTEGRHKGGKLTIAKLGSRDPLT